MANVPHTAQRLWFVHFGDHYEGPLNAEQISLAIRKGKIQLHHMAWARGMPDWIRVGDILEFNPEAQTSSPSNPQYGGEITGLMRVGNAHDDGPTPTGTIDPRLLEKAKREADAMLTRMEQEQLYLQKNALKANFKITLPKIRKNIILFLFGLGSFVFIGFLFSENNHPEKGRPWALKMLNTFPSLAKHISPIPKIPELNSDENYLLRQVAELPVSSTSPQVAAVPIDSASGTPKFWLSANVPDGTRIIVFFNAKPETLLERHDFKTSSEVLVDNKIARSAQVTPIQGGTLPQGEYAIEAHLTTGDTAKILFKGVWFLGGAPDEKYKNALAEYQLKIRDKAKKEIEEIKFFFVDLESHCKVPIEKADQILKIKSKLLRKRPWVEHHTRWLETESKLSETLKNWLDESVLAQRQLPKTYRVLSPPAQLCNQLESLLDRYFQGNPNAPAPHEFEKQKTDLSTQIFSALNELKQSMENKEKQVLTTTGYLVKE